MKPWEFSVKQYSSDRALAVKHFLYRVYADEMGWLPEDGNPSDWTVKEDGQGGYFTDKFDDTAVWFGVFNAGEQAAVGRVIVPVESKLEVELYQEIPARFKVEGILRAEINRLAVAKKYNKSPALSKLMCAMYGYILAEKIDYLVGGIPNPTLAFAKAFGFKPLEPPLIFSYSGNDTDDAQVMYLDLKGSGRAQQIIQRLTSETVFNLKFFDEEVH